MSTRHNLPLQHFLSSLPIDCSPALLDDVEHTAPTLQAAVDILRRAGVFARVVRLEEAGLEGLELPALVELSQDDVVLVKSATRHSVVCVTQAGEVSITRENFDKLCSDRAIEATLSVHPTRSAAANLGALAARERVLLARLAMSAAAAAVLGAATPALSAFIIDRALPSAATDLLTVLVVAFLITAIHVRWLGWLRDGVVIDLRMRMERHITERLMNHLLRLPLSDSLSMSVADRIQGIESAQALSSALLNLASPIIEGGAAVSSVAFLVLADPAVASVVVLACLALAGFAVVIGRSRGNTEARATKAAAKQSAAVFELVRGIQDLKVAAAEHYVLDIWRSRFVVWLEAQLSMKRVALASGVVDELGSRIIMAFLLYWRARAALEERISIGVCVAELQCTVLILGAVSQFGDTASSLWTAFAHYARIRRSLEMPADRDVLRRTPEKLADEGIFIEDLWFRHGPESPWILTGFSLHVKPGDVHEITWPSGSGKTTLLRLLAGLYRPEKGIVRIGGCDAAMAKDIVTYLPQQVNLLAGTVLDNLRWFSGGASYSRLTAAAHATGLARLVSSWPSGLETRVGSDGVGISGGQAQIIALTAALASSRPVLLLDEATAHLDRGWRIELARSSFLRGRTVISAVHDPLGPADVA